MTALELALEVKAAGGTFGYNAQGVIVLNATDLPSNLRAQVEARIGDIVSVVSEHSYPTKTGAAFVLDAARAILTPSLAMK